MSDKMLSAEKVKAWINANRQILSDDNGRFVAALPHNAFLDAIDSGRLDSCVKCGNTGVVATYPVMQGDHLSEIDEPCDCPAGTGGSEK